MISTHKPWKLVNNYDELGKLLFCSLINNQTETIAEIYLEHDSNGEILEEDFFMLNLIKSAPQLYDTLELVKFWMQATGQGFDFVYTIDTALREARGELPAEKRILS